MGRKQAGTREERARLAARVEEVESNSDHLSALLPDCTEPLGTGEKKKPLGKWGLGKRTAGKS